MRGGWPPSIKPPHVFAEALAMQQPALLNKNCSIYLVSCTMWSIFKNCTLFIFEIRDEPARPGPVMTLFYGSYLKYMKR